MNLEIVRRNNDFDILPRGDEGPAFTFRYLSVRKFRDTAGLFDAVADSKSPNEAVDNVVKVLQSGLMNWTAVESNDPGTLEAFGLQPADDANVSLPFRSDLLDAVVSLRDLMSMVNAFMSEQNPTAPKAAEPTAAAAA